MLDPKINNNENNSFIKGLEAGIKGSIAVSAQVSSLMWIRTITNYQYVHGTSFQNTFMTLYNQGGISRFYRGIIPSLIITPLSRFGDTSTNSFALSYLGKETSVWKTAVLSSVLAGGWRIAILPIENWKTHKQVYGKDGFAVLKNSVKQNGIKELYKGGYAYFGYSVVGNYGWFGTYNFITKKYPIKDNDLLYQKIGKSIFYGISSSLAADTLSNSFRVLKTIKQTDGRNISYKKINNNIIKKEGKLGIFKRGLTTSLMGNSIQAGFFSIIFTYLMGNF